MIVLTFLIPDLSVRRVEKTLDRLKQRVYQPLTNYVLCTDPMVARGSLSCHSAPAKLQARSVTPLRTDERIPTANFSSHLDTHQEDFI
ncbi:unnamed protein product [Leptidea sinapis]|uniref:Uncharacterized protein n=1 Tax=Leptidea sinapis TaxID=189913 RepID=A0A5E4PUS1_9NEOP|nr:unnamed protein product [Leptidea sinapis]